MLGKKLKESRKKCGFTQSYVADKIGVEIGTISGYERNYRKPNPETLAELAKLYGISVDYILGQDKPTFEIKTRDEQEIEKKLADLTEEERSLAIPAIKLILDGIQKNKIK